VRCRPSGPANPVFCLTVTHRSGRTASILGCAALAAAITLAAAGCSGSAAPATSTGGTAAHAVTLAQARAVYSGYIAASTTAAQQGNAAHGLSIAGDMQWAILHAQYTARATTGTPVTRYRYGTPVFYVPALLGYPLWFLVSVPVTVVTGTGTGGTMLMAFQRFDPARIWTLDGSVLLDQPLPAIARDRDGYAIALSDTAAGLLLPPDLVGATQAAVVDEGPTAPAAAVLSSGPQTTGLFGTLNAADSAATARGLSYQWLLQSASYAQYELAAAGGGALVIYPMYLNTQLEHPGDLAGPPIPAPANFVPIITTPSKAGPHGVVANWTYEFAAVDPPQTAHGAKVQVIGANGAPTYGHPY
jgi:hypothetical protein